MSRVAQLACLFLSVGCTAVHDSIPRCVPGMAVACACTDGSAGAQTCAADGAYLPCTCARDAAAPTDAGDGCASGEAVACLCPDGLESVATCNDRGLFLPCVCGRDAGPFDAPDAPVRRDTPRHDGPLCFAPEPEFCDGRDNDCDGLVDDDHVCPDDTVIGTVPFEGSVSYLGTTHEGACGFGAIRPFWPSLGPIQFGELDCRLNPLGLALHPTSGALYVLDPLVTGTFTRLDASGSEPVSTPPCARPTRYRFDPTGTVYYECGDRHLYRGAGEDLGVREGGLHAVLASGRTIVTRGRTGELFALLDADGAFISAPALDAYPGRIEASDPTFVTTAELGFVLVYRTLYDMSHEAMVLRVDGDTGGWTVVRRLGITEGELGQRPLALPDGRVLAMRGDPETASPEREILEYPPDGPPRVVWRERDELEVRIHGQELFLVGPRL